jgi:hypothetical protein
MNVNLVGMDTGTTSARLLWDPTQDPGATFNVYRGTTNVFGSATKLTSSALAVGAFLYNDYSASADTLYYYWLEDQNSNVFGPASVTTDAVTPSENELDETQLNALFTWANTVLGGLYPIQWAYQPLDQGINPKVVLNVVSVEKPLYSDDLRANNQVYAGARTALISVTVSSVPQSSERTLISIPEALSGTYTVTINGVAFTVTYRSAPTNTTVILQALLALIQADYDNAGLCGLDPANQILFVQPTDGNVEELTITVSSNINTPTTAQTPKAMSIAQTLRNSLEDPVNRDPLWAANIAIAAYSVIRDISTNLQTSAELRAQFDLDLNLAAVTQTTPPIIDTVTPLTGTYS